MEWMDGGVSTNLGGLLSTKFFVPVPRVPTVPRERITRRLDEGLTRRLTLVCAPAGSGKTTALATWFGTLSARGVRGSWLTLDSADADPVRFWSYLLAACQALGVEVPPARLLRAPQRPPLEAMLAALVNALAADRGEFVLVLDDYQQVGSSEVHRSVTALVESIPPNVHLYLSTRSEPPLPLPRLRARGELTELTGAEL